MLSKNYKSTVYHRIIDLFKGFDYKLRLIGFWFTKMNIQEIGCIFVLSNSRILKERFLALIKTKNVDFDTEKISEQTPNGQGFQVTWHKVSSTNEFKTVLIDTNDKGVVAKVLSLCATTKNDAHTSDSPSKYNLISIIYLFDEANRDTLTYVQSTHKDLRTKFGDYFAKTNVPFLLINLQDILVSRRAVKPDDHSDNETTTDPNDLADVIERFLDDNKDFKYIVQPNLHNKENSSEESLKSVLRNFQSLSESSFKKTFSHELAIKDLNMQTDTYDEIQINHFAKLNKPAKIQQKNYLGDVYTGEVVNSLRNGLYIRVAN
jgi:hypothetical protein